MTHEANRAAEISAAPRECADALARRSTMDAPEESSLPASPPVAVPAELAALDIVRYVIGSFFVGVGLLVVLFILAVLIGGLGADDY